MILLEKLFSKYSKKELEGIFPREYVYELINYRIQPRLTSIAGRFDVVNELNYTYEDFLTDYKNYAEYKENKLLFDLYKKGITAKDAAIKFDYNETSFLAYLRNGIPLNKGTKIEKMKAYYIEDTIDIQGMKYKIIDNHCELYASKEELEKFRDKYNIDEDIIYSETKKTWHLAFTGYWFYLIKYNKIKGVL